MIFDGAQLAAFTAGRCVHPGRAGPIHTDSRRLPAGAWFLALTGDRFDGHGFLGHALASGCAGVVVSDPRRVPAQWSAGLVVVENTLNALQALGRAARAALAVPTVGITGSAGKTTTRGMVSEVLRAQTETGLRVHHTVGNLNNHIGVPLTLCAAPPDAERLVIEMGMNHPGEIALLQAIAAPDLRVITNVGPAHVEGCGSLQGVALAKQELFDGARPGDVCIVNDDDERVRIMPIPDDVRVVRFGRSERNTVRLTDVFVDPVRLQTRLRVETPDGPVAAVLGVPGAHLAECAMAAIACGFVLRVPVSSMGRALGQYQPEGMRNRVEHVGGVVVLDDAYNANPLSMVAALRTLAALPGAHHAALGDMLELGGAEAEAHADVLRLALELGLYTHLCGPRFAAAARAFGHPAGVQCYADTDVLGQALRRVLAPGDALLVKGSRGSRMERVVEILRQPGAMP